MNEIREINLRILFRHYREQTPLSLAFALVGESGETDETVARLLRDAVHSRVEESSDREAADSIMHLLDFCSILELASLVDYIPRHIPDDLRRTLLCALQRPAVEELYRRECPRPMVSLFRSRLQGKNDLRIEAPAALPLFLQMLDLAPMLDENLATRDFIRSLCHAERSTVHLFLSRAIESPESYLARMSAGDELLMGFSSFLRFCQSFSTLLAEADHVALLQSALWHHVGHWFEGLRTAALPELDDLLSRFLGWECYLEPQGDAFSTSRESIERLRGTMRELCGTRFREALLVASATATPRRENAPGIVVGIDFGTTQSAIAVMEGSEAKVIPNAEGSRTTPSVVAFTKAGERLVGQIAKLQSVTNPKNTIFSIKRFMGRKYSEVSEEMQMVPYTVERADNGEVGVVVQGNKYSPPEISAMILGKLKQAAEDYLGEKVEKAVITVPAYFNDSQRQATKDAGRIAGLNVERLINEPTAAALAYGLDKKKDQTIAVYNFGGGSFDISILKLGEGVVEVKATNGDNNLGGDNIDQRVIDWLLEKFKMDQGVDLGNDPMALQRLKEAAENAKIQLSSAMETDINLPFITADASGPKHLNLRLTRRMLEHLVEDLVHRSLELCKRALDDAKVSLTDIEEVMLVGGQTYMPAIQKVVRDFFGKEPHRGVYPDEVVAVGAAIQGAMLRGEVNDVMLLDLTSLSLGIETLGGVFTKIIDRNTTIPARKTEVFSTAVDNQASVEVHVLQGERQMARYNHTLGKFHLDGIPAAPRGRPQIEVAFDIDASGIVHVSAKDLGTGKEQKITITVSSGLSHGEIERMVKEADSHSDEDKEQRLQVETRNQLDALIYSTDKTYNEHKAKLEPDDEGQIEQALAEAKQALESENAAKMQQATTRLEQASHKLTYSPSIGATADPASAPLASGLAEQVLPTIYESSE